ncbi:MAG: 3-deoxy-D-manno-octulosonic acid transferase [Deltaproteobacteria bacterium]|nr:3-deoxy-D-manno-octulosonic acid transferase [Deltaproteobacteria bacterium]
MFWKIAYNGVFLPLVWLLAWGVSRIHPKVGASWRGRHGLWERIEAQLADRDPAKPLAWFHVSSAGEYLQAQPVMERLTAAGWQVALTVFSVTGYQWASRRRGNTRNITPGNPGNIIVVDYLPLDFPGNTRRMLALLRPNVVVCVKFDLWPNMLWQIARAKVPLYLISGTLRADSLRINNPLGRSLSASLHQCFTAILAVTEEDRQRFLSTLPNHPQVIHGGDTRFDSVLDRKKTLAPPQVPDWLSRAPVFMAGSTWPADEEYLLPVLRRALEKHPELVAVVVPHEVGEPHLKAVEQGLAGHSIIRWTAMTPGSSPHRVVLVDTVGQLSTLYQLALLAYVGGGFSSGVHNTMEPAAMGVPPLFGPRHKNSPEAMELARLGLAYPIADGPSLEKQLTALLADPKSVRETGRRAARFIEDHGGASDTCFQILDQHR